VVIRGVLIEHPGTARPPRLDGIAADLAPRARSRNGTPRTPAPAGVARAQLASCEAHGQDPLGRHLTTTCSCQRGGGVVRSVRLNIHVGAGPVAAALQLKSIR